MEKRHRISIFLISMVVLTGIFYLWNGQFLPTSSTSTIIYTSLVMISFVTLFLEHWFTKPTDVLASSISILLVLAPLHGELDRLGIWYNIFFFYSFTMLLAALTALILLDGEKASSSIQNRFSFHLKAFATTFGNGRLLYFALFILTLLFYVESQSTIFMILFFYSAIILLADPTGFFVSLVTKNSTQSDDIGEIISVQSKNTFLVKLYKKRKSVRKFDFVEFSYSMEESKEIRKGMIYDNYLLNEQHWVKVLTSQDITDAVGSGPSHKDIKDNVVYKIMPEDAGDLLKRFVGVVVDQSNIMKLRFEYSSTVPVAEGTLLEVQVGEHTVLYQIIQGITDTEVLESKNETGHIIGHAIQLGTWQRETLSFERFGWVPEINSPVYLVKEIEDIAVPDEEVLAGYIPDTKFPVLLNKNDAISHHLAILGVTGSGKSVFARNLIREFAGDGTKIICVDFTNEYEKRFADIGIEPIVGADSSKEMFNAIDLISKELAEFANKRDLTLIAKNEAILRKGFTAAITKFLTSENKIVVFELPDISNTSGILDYTRWFFKILFEIARKEKNFGQQICVVLEEAHTVVPEWNFVSSDDRGAQALVNSISQIALQGRKYNIGFMVIAQRTANVSKTILTQCNTIVAFQQFDKTSADFLTNYMGSELVGTLSMLRPRHAVAVGKAFRSGIPTIFKVPEIEEPEEKADPE